MPWSPRELAVLTGTSVKAIRYYHQIGVLDEPDRAPNGYRQYTVDHLLRLLSIRRLTDLGVPLAQVSQLDRSADSTTVLRAVEARVGQTIAHWERVRAELVTLIEQDGQLDVPSGFADLAGDLSAADRSLLVVMARVLDGPSLEHVHRLVRHLPRTEAEDAFDALSPDATEERVRRVAHLLAARQQQLDGQVRPALRGRCDAGPTSTLLTEAVEQLYNPAQREALRRAREAPS